MFVRVKKAKGRSYAYLVQNEWTPWGSRQMVKEYLGRVEKPERKTENKTKLPEGIQEAITSAIAQELINHGFKQQERKLINKNTTVNLENKTIRTKGRKTALEINEGYLCEHTIKQLLNFKASEKNEKTMLKLANNILEAGLKLDGEQVLHIFEQVVKQK